MGIYGSYKVHLRLVLGSESMNWQLGSVKSTGEVLLFSPLCVINGKYTSDVKPSCLQRTVYCVQEQTKPTVNNSIVLSRN